MLASRVSSGYRSGMPQSSKPHDKFFRDILSQKDVAVDFLQNYLPPRVSEHVDLNSLAICKDTFVDKKWADYHSDMLYQVTFSGNRPGFVYFLFEHKSYHHHFLALQMLRYMLEIWELYCKQHSNSQKLPLIIPISIYHGKQDQRAIKLSELVDLPDTAFDLYVPNFEISFYDFSPGSEQEIKGAITVKLLLSCFRAKNEPAELRHVVEIFKLLNQLDDDETALKWVEVIFRYMLDTMDISKQDIRKVARQALSAGKEETIMTLAEQLRQEGRQKGRQEGRQEERTELFNRLLRKRFGSVLDAHVQKRLQNATPDQIDRWFDRILEAGSIEDVLDDKP